MVVQSLFNQTLKLAPLTVEVQLVPGIPEIKILGLPDAATRESAVRVKAAIRAAGFEFPVTRTVLVQLRPADERKTSSGLDLAIAAGLLWETDQIPKPDAPVLAYGELSLCGSVRTPQDFAVWSSDGCEVRALTGTDVDGFHSEHFGITHLRELSEPQRLPPRTLSWWRRPEIPERALLSPRAARVLSLVALGRHTVLLAGPAGTGKTSSLELMSCLAPPPEPEEGDYLRRLHSVLTGEQRHSRPFVTPHHMMSAVALVGGGQPPRPGEITRAHGGFLLLDEFLEFSPMVIEALREPLQNKKIRISKGVSPMEFPADFQLLATTNLCPCGRFVPSKDTGCVCSTTRRIRYLSRLNGPVLDRIEMLGFTDEWSLEERTVTLQSLTERIDIAVDRLRSRSGKALRCPESLWQKLNMDDLSFRRRAALDRVARTIALLDGEEQVSPRSFCESFELTVAPFLKLIKSIRG